MTLRIGPRLERPRRPAHTAALSRSPARPRKPHPSSLSQPPDWPAQFTELSVVTAGFFAARRP
jgi:hypothetical protein